MSTKRSTRMLALGAVGLLAVGTVSPTAAQGTTIEMIQSGYSDQMQPYFDDLDRAVHGGEPRHRRSRSRSSPGTTSTTSSTPVSSSGDPPDIVNLNYFANFAADGLLYTADEIVCRPRSWRTSSRPSATTRSTRARSTPSPTSPATACSSTTRHPRGSGRRSSAGHVERAPRRLRAIKATHAGHHPARDAARTRGGAGRVPHLGRAATVAATSATAQWVINSPENLETLEFLQQLVDNGCTQPNPGHDRPHLWRVAAVRRGRRGDGQRRRLPAGRVETEQG